MCGTVVQVVQKRANQDSQKPKPRIQLQSRDEGHSFSGVAHSKISALVGWLPCSASRSSSRAARGRQRPRGSCVCLPRSVLSPPDREGNLRSWPISNPDEMALRASRVRQARARWRFAFRTDCAELGARTTTVHLSLHCPSPSLGVDYLPLHLRLLRFDFMFVS